MEFEKINWLPIPKRISRCSLCSVYKFYSKNCPEYLDEIYFPLESNGVQTCSTYQKLKVPDRKINIGQKALSYVGPSLLNNLHMEIKTSTSLNAFIKDNFPL